MNITGPHKVLSLPFPNQLSEDNLNYMKDIERTTMRRVNPILTIGVGLAFCGAIGIIVDCISLLKRRRDLVQVNALIENFRGSRATTLEKGE